VVLGVMVFACLAVAPAANADDSEASEPDVFAYYYIWFDPTSWQRAKSDLPLLGNYSSDESRVMRRHIELAQAAGVDGFVVSWKHTPKLDRRLARLLDLAQQYDFEIAIMYQGLDFEREPLPAARVATDLDHLVRRFGSHPALHRTGARIVVAWSGTWRFSLEEIRATTVPRRDALAVLATERTAEDYARLAEVVDGDAYYWSSANPETFPGYEEKLALMGSEIRRTGGLWWAPAAPGFDARLVGGRSVVEREGGETLRRQWNAASSSHPDVVALISWNEFSENTHLEPSTRFGNRYLDVIADLTHTTSPRGELDSDSPGGTRPERRAVIAIAGLLAVTSLSIARVRRRQRTTPFVEAEG
jgi:hypothetical protein